MVKAAFTNLENINAWFISQKMPYFTLYRGDKVQPSNTVLRNVDIPDLDDAWNFLEVNLSNLSINGGTYLLFITDKPKHNLGLSTLIELNPVYQPQQVGIAGIGGVPGMPFVGGGNLETYIQGQISGAVEKAVLLRKVEDLEAALEEKESGGFIGRIVENLTSSEQFPSMLNVLLSRILGPEAQPVMAGISGFTPEANTESSMTDQASTEDNLNEEDIRVFACIDKLSQHFPDPVAALEKITAFVEKNPTMAKQLLTTI